MSKICAHCLRKFPWGYDAQLGWCKVEKIYVCRRCWEDVCKEGHGKGDKNRAWNPLFYFLFVNFFLGLVLPFAIVGLIDIYYVTTWNNMDSTDISDLPESGWVRLEGTLVGEDGDIVIYGSEDTWNWDENEKFTLHDSTGNISINPRKYYKIERGPHKFTNGIETEETAYIVGDEVKLICEVSNEDGSKKIYLLWLGEDEEAPMVQFGSFLTFFIIIIPVILGYLALLVRALRMRAKHKRKVEYRNPIEIKNTDFPKEEGLGWHSNPSTSKRKIRTISALMLLFAFLIFVLFYLLFQWFFHTQLHYWGAAFIWLAILPTMVFLPIILLYDRGITKPNEVAVTKYGVHFYYKDPIMRYLDDDFIGWDEIKDVKIDKAEKSINWIIEKKNNTSYNLNVISEDNCISINAGWIEYKRKSKHQ